MPLLSVKHWLLACCMLPLAAVAQSVMVVTNHVGYETNSHKKAILVATSPQQPRGFELIDQEDHRILAGKLVNAGTVDHWQHKYFWTIDFSAVRKPGKYKLVVHLPGKDYSSTYFVVGDKILERQTLSDVIYYFKGQRSSGLLDQADRRIGLLGTRDTIDSHGGWYDATGDYGKHLSHLSFSTYFNPQQISLTVWSLLNTYDLLGQRTGNDFRQFRRRLLDEAIYGADYLTRIQARDGSFFRSVSAPGPGKRAIDRVIRPEEKNYRIKQTKDQSFTTGNDDHHWQSFQASYRAGAGIAIAALARAAMYDTCGEYSNRQYLEAAKNAFAFLEKHNAAMTNDGKENIVDDYCALAAATALFKATAEQQYQEAAATRAARLIQRLHSWQQYNGYWAADDHDRPFFHPSDAGLPVVALLQYYPFASEQLQRDIATAVRKSFHYELAVTGEVNNPFGYSRQLVQDTLGNRRSSFFFPHNSEASPWWQGENARLGSMATAARMTAKFFVNDKPFADSLQQFADDQLNWILGLNPYDACMLQGAGHNNPAYGFFGTFEYTNAPGGIVNGITAGMDDERDIAFNLSYAQTGKDNDWRWAEQWLPHAAWYLWAVAVGAE
ncbi:cellulase-like Ig domain-containing protein [Chitinophaga dinghuensis]|uniref:Cellulase-like Ig domain-containing protein n=1 Tax=Chitinophaga dinghuensis TaxID=1539050 RepID=A0A327VYU2_9BACT|nr:glycoside hydrolase family 9 protein [Chitinophaga dinghuensis]RAJ82197.1 cellulase-like Ig domain-containing protein [Chitinophaga dinghuensis]